MGGGVLSRHWRGFTWWFQAGTEEGETEMMIKHKINTFQQKNITTAKRHKPPPLLTFSALSIERQIQIHKYGNIQIHIVCSSALFLTIHISNLYLSFYLAPIIWFVFVFVFVFMWLETVLQIVGAFMPTIHIFDSNLYFTAATYLLVLLSQDFLLYTIKPLLLTIVLHFDGFKIILVKIWEIWWLIVDTLAQVMSTSPKSKSISHLMVIIQRWNQLNCHVMNV